MPKALLEHPVHLRPDRHPVRRAPDVHRRLRASPRGAAAGHQRLGLHAGPAHSRSSSSRGWSHRPSVVVSWGGSSPRRRWCPDPSRPTAVRGSASSSRSSTTPRRRAIRGDIRPLLAVVMVGGVRVLAGPVHAARRRSWRRASTTSEVEQHRPWERLQARRSSGTKDSPLVGFGAPGADRDRAPPDRDPRPVLVRDVRPRLRRRSALLLVAMLTLFARHRASPEHPRPSGPTSAS